MPGGTPPEVRCRGALVRSDGGHVASRGACEGDVPTPSLRQQGCDAARRGCCCCKRRSRPRRGDVAANWCGVGSSPHGFASKSHKSALCRSKSPRTLHKSVLIDPPSNSNSGWRTGRSFIRTHSGDRGIREQGLVAVANSDDMHSNNEHTCRHAARGNVIRVLTALHMQGFVSLA